MRIPFDLLYGALLRLGASLCPGADADHSLLLFGSPMLRNSVRGWHLNEGIWLSALCVIVAANEKSIGLKVIELGLTVQRSGITVAEFYQNITVRNDN